MDDLTIEGWGIHPGGRTAT